jgi:hypothetical protein
LIGRVSQCECGVHLPEPAEGLRQVPRGVHHGAGLQAHPRHHVRPLPAGDSRHEGVRTPIWRLILVFFQKNVCGAFARINLKDFIQKRVQAQDFTAFVLLLVFSYAYVLCTVDFL